MSHAEARVRNGRSLVRARPGCGGSRGAHLYPAEACTDYAGEDRRSDGRDRAPQGAGPESTSRFDSQLVARRQTRPLKRFTALPATGEEEPHVWDPDQPPHGHKRRLRFLLDASHRSAPGTFRPSRIMGVAHNFRCPNCHYHVDAMISGYDYGMSSHLYAVSCADCRELRAAELPGHPWDLSGNREEREEAALARYRLTCPRSPSHQVSPWSHPGPCPRCGTTLQAKENVLMWD